MIYNLNSMAERRETGSRITDARLALTALLAAAGLSLAGCNQSEAKAQTTPEGTIQLATAEEAVQFAQLSDSVRIEIRQNFADCMADVEDFAAEETDPEMRAFELEDGAADCDSIRISEIRSAIADQGIEEITRSITTG